MLKPGDISRLAAILMLLIPLTAICDSTGYEKPDVSDELLEKAAKYLDRGAYHAEKHAYKAAISEFEKAAEISPQIFNAPYNIARMYQEMGKNKAAIEQLQLLNKTFDKNIAGFNLLGQILVAEGRENEAIDQFKTAISNGEEILEKSKLPQAKADIALAYHNLGSQLAAQGEYEEAEKYLTKSVEADNTNYFSYFALGQVLSRLGKFNAAVDAFKKAGELNVHFVETDIELAKTYMNGRPLNIMSAISALKDALRKDPKRAEIHQLLGDCYMLRGLNDDRTKQADLMEAMTHYRDASDLDKDNQRYRILLARACALAGEYDQAEKVIEKLDPEKLDEAGNRQIYLVQGHILKSRAKWAEAAKKYEAAFAIDPSDFAACTEAGVCYLEAKNTDKATALLEKAVNGLKEAGAPENDENLKKAEDFLLKAREKQGN